MWHHHHGFSLQCQWISDLYFMGVEKIPGVVAIAWNTVMEEFWIICPSVSSTWQFIRFRSGDAAAALLSIWSWCFFNISVNNKLMNGSLCRSVRVCYFFWLLRDFYLHRRWGFILGPDSILDLKHITIVLLLLGNFTMMNCHYNSAFSLQNVFNWFLLKHLKWMLLVEVTIQLQIYQLAESLLLI